MVYVCRKEYFSAAHKLYNSNWSKEKNCEVFGVCANDHWHGHNFELIVTVKGRPASDTGYVIDLKQLGIIIQERIIEKVHHKNLNEDVPFLQGMMPSCENLAIAFWKEIFEPIRKASPAATLHCIELVETKKNIVKYFGEE
jgi:6-pyruvoyltetrahydropterin/6-carboxytetrahydropterin synthase